MSLTKNPLIVQSANYIYNWFNSKIETDKDVLNFNTAEEVEGDLFVLNHLKRNYNNKVQYENIEARYNEAMSDEA